MHRVHNHSWAFQILASLSVNIWMHPTEDFSLFSWDPLHTALFIPEHMNYTIFGGIYPRTAQTPSDRVHLPPVPGSASIEYTHRLPRLRTAAACTKPISIFCYTARPCPSLSNTFQIQHLLETASTHSFWSYGSPPHLTYSLQSSSGYTSLYSKLKWIFHLFWHMKTNRELPVFREIKRAAQKSLAFTAPTSSRTASIVHGTLDLNEKKWEIFKVIRCRFKLSTQQRWKALTTFSSISLSTVFAPCLSRKQIVCGLVHICANSVGKLNHLFNKMIEHSIVQRNITQGEG